MKCEHNKGVKVKKWIAGRGINARNTMDFSDHTSKEKKVAEAQIKAVDKSHKLCGRAEEIKHCN